MHKQWANVTTEDRAGRRWKAGRAHLALATGPRTHGDARPPTEAVFGAEWAHLHRTLRDVGLKVSTTGEETLDLHWGLGPIGQHWVNATIHRHGRFIRLPRVRFDIRLRATGISWCFGDDPHSWSRDAPLRERLQRGDLTWWRVHRHRMSAEHVETVAEVVRLPEADVDVTITLEREVWGWLVGPYGLTRRSRRRLRFFLPFGRRIEYRVTLDAPDGRLTFPGKGENSWDIGQDAIYSASQLYRGHVDERREWVAFAMGDAVTSVLRNRLRYGTSTADTGV